MTKNASWLSLAGVHLHNFAQKKKKRKKKNKKKNQAVWKQKTTAPEMLKKTVEKIYLKKDKVANSEKTTKKPSTTVQRVAWYLKSMWK